MKPRRFIEKKPNEERYRQRALHNLNQRASKLGMKLVAAEGA